MIGRQGKSFLSRTLEQQSRYNSLVSGSFRGFAGGGAKKPAIDPNCTDFDLILVGKYKPVPPTKLPSICLI